MCAMRLGYEGMIKNLELKKIIYACMYVTERSEIPKHPMIIIIKLNFYKHLLLRG